MTTKALKSAELIETINRLELTPDEAIAIIAEYGKSKCVALDQSTISVTKQEIFDEVKTYLEKDCHYLDYNIQLTSCIADIDNIDVITLIMTLEVKYSVVIKDHIADKWQTIEDVVETVYDLLCKK